MNFSFNKTSFKNNQTHSFHLVDSSPWAIICSFGIFSLTVGFSLYVNNFSGGFICLLTGLITIIYIMFVWWRDIIRETVFEGQHTSRVKWSHRFGMILFIISEIMFFFAFFWSFFHFSLSPSHEIGGIFPPIGINVLSPWEIPLINTMFLLLSGFTVTFCHELIIFGNRKLSLISLLWTIFLAVIFTSFQLFEYFHSPFDISDGVYGSTFFLFTGFHGFHVFVGTIFLMICFIRLYNNHFTKEHHFGFEAACWYWHFVDVVWLFLFITVYWWSS